MVDGVRVDGLEVEEGHKRVIHKDHGVIVTVELYRDHLGHTVGIQTPLLALTLYPSLRQWDVALNQTVSRHASRYPIYHTTLNPTPYNHLIAFKIFDNELT